MATCYYWVSITNLAKHARNAPVKCAATSSELGLQNRVTWYTFARLSGQIVPKSHPADRADHHRCSLADCVPSTHTTLHFTPITHFKFKNQPFKPLGKHRRSIAADPELKNSARTQWRRTADPKSRTAVLFSELFFKQESVPIYTNAHLRSQVARQKNLLVLSAPLSLPLRMQSIENRSRGDRKQLSKWTINRESAFHKDCLPKDCLLKKTNLCCKILIRIL